MPPAEPLTQDPTLREAVSQALVSRVELDDTEAWRFAMGILPAFSLIRSLFSVNEVDTTLKLMLLHELSRAQGRATMERIRGLASFLEADRVDGLVRSLQGGGWLDLRASDNTYAASMSGLNLLALLHAADLANVSPANALARAAQNAEFGAKLEGGHAALAYLVDQLRVILEGQVEEARAVIRQGRPHRLIAWAQREHLAQLETLRGVLALLQDRLDAASREFFRVTRLHETMQELVRMHTSIHERLREWNLVRLHSTEGGYNVGQLCEGVLGASDAVWAEVLSQGILTLPALAPSLGTDEIRARFQGARRRLAGQEEPFVYTPPTTAEHEPFSVSEVDEVETLRSWLTRVFEGRASSDPPLSPQAWLPPEAISSVDLGVVAWRIACLCRLESASRTGPGTFELCDGRRVRLLLPPPEHGAVPTAELLSRWTELDVLVRLEFGWLSHLRLELLEDAHA